MGDPSFPRCASARALTRSAEVRSPLSSLPTCRPAPSRYRDRSAPRRSAEAFSPRRLGPREWQARDAIGECVGASGMVCVGYRAGRVEARVAERLSAGLGGGQGGNRALADHLALALGSRSGDFGFAR